MCGTEIPVGKAYYNISFNEEREKVDDTFEVIDKVKLMVFCMNWSDTDNTYKMFKTLCREAGVLT